MSSVSFGTTPPERSSISLLRGREADTQDSAKETGDSDASDMNATDTGETGRIEETWLDWAAPDDGLARNAVVGANRYYGTALHRSVLIPLGTVLGNGAIWIIEKRLKKSGH
jgi:hypothetical protein